MMDPWSFQPSPFHCLVPVPHYKYAFTTNTSADLSNFANSPPYFAIVQVDLTDKALGVHKISSHTAHPSVVTPPHPTTPAQDMNRNCLPLPNLAWEAFYPKGSINPSAEIPGGLGFYLNGPKDFSDRLHGLSDDIGASEIVMSYRMMLQSDWEWAKGGKLPGLFGGVGDLAYGCTGGRKNNRESCFDVRLMWRSKGTGELYVYLPLTERNRERLLAVPPLSLENSDYGFSVGRGAFSIPVGRWISIAIRIRLNTVGDEDGEIELWIDGHSVISIASLTLRHSEKSRLKGMHFQTFFGGSKADWASSKDQRAWFADVTGTVC